MFDKRYLSDYVDYIGLFIMYIVNSYRNLFAKLTTEELEAGWADEHDDDIPNFGDSQSSYEEVG